MYNPYFDIRAKAGDPLWHDKHGVPRYCTFHPKELDVYDDYAALLEIHCQACERPFLVASHFSKMQIFQNTKTTMALEDIDGGLPTARDAGWFGFGDATWHGDENGGGWGCAGPTMTTSVYRIIEFWTKDGGRPIVRTSIDAPPTIGIEWRRRFEYEFTYPEGV